MAKRDRRSEAWWARTRREEPTKKRCLATGGTARREFCAETSAAKRISSLWTAQPSCSFRVACCCFAVLLFCCWLFGWLFVWLVVCLVVAFVVLCCVVCCFVCFVCMWVVMGKIGRCAEADTVGMLWMVISQEYTVGHQRATDAMET